MSTYPGANWQELKCRGKVHKPTFLCDYSEACVMLTGWAEDGHAFQCTWVLDDFRLGEMTP